MKKIIILLTGVLMYCFANAQTENLKLNGNFEWPSITTFGWKVVDVVPTLEQGYAHNKTWAIGLYGSPLYSNSPQPTFNTPPDGDVNNKKVGAFYNGGGNSTDSWLISPRVDSIKESDYLCFWVDNSLGGLNYNMEVLISTTNDQTTSFTKKIISFKAENLYQQNWKYFAFSLADYIGKNVYIAFRIYYDMYNFNGAIQLDNITVGPVSMPDLELLDIISPDIPLQNVQDSVEITAVVRNVGTAVTSFDMWYKKASAHSYDYTQHYKFDRSIDPLDTIHVTFPKKEIFYLGTRDTLSLFLGIANDVNRLNDTINTIVDNVVPGSIPYTNGFEIPDDIAGLKIYNTQKDESTWTEDLNSAAYARHGNGSIRYSGNPNTDADDWVFSKSIYFPTAKTYEITFWYGTTDEFQPQTLNVKWTKAQKYQGAYQMWYLFQKSNITNKIPQNNLETRGYEQAVARFDVETPGYYYIAFQCASAKTTQAIAQLYIDDLAVDYATEIDESDNSNEVLVFPNPANSAVQIQGDQIIEKIDVYNLLGQKLSSQNFNTRYATLDVNELSTGMYIIKIATEKGELTKKINIAR